MDGKWCTHKHQFILVKKYIFILNCVQESVPREINLPFLLLSGHHCDACTLQHSIHKARCRRDQLPIDTWVLSDDHRSPSLGARRPPTTAAPMPRPGVRDAVDAEAIEAEAGRPEERAVYTRLCSRPLRRSLLQPAGDARAGITRRTAPPSNHELGGTPAASDSPAGRPQRRRRHNR